MIDFLASEPHFADHLRPIWEALPEECRGTFHRSGPLPRAKTLTVVAAAKDMRTARNAGRPVVLSEHGSGQSYVDNRGLPIRSSSYIGSPDRDGVVAVLVPGEQQARQHLSAHPKIPAHAVGCPKLDDFHGRPRILSDPVVAVSFHWECTVVPETKSAWPEYRGQLVALSQRYKLLGHGHPRHMDMLANWYRKHDIEVVRDFAEVCERATVYACDNSSTLFEFASLGRAVVVLNSRHYRRGVEHGLRFWEHADMGVQCERPAELANAVAEALRDSPPRATRRREVVRQVYAVTDGTAAARAAKAVMEIAGGASWPSSESNSTMPVSASSSGPPR